MTSALVNIGSVRHFVICNERLLPRFGVDRLLLLLGQSLVRQGHRVTFVCLRCDRSMVERISPQLHILDGIGSLSIQEAEARAADLLRAGWSRELFADGAPDVLISGGWPFFSAASVCADRNVRSVFIDAGAVPHDGMTPLGLPTQRELRRIRAAALPKFSAVFPISGFIAESQTLPDRGSRHGVETILLGADHLETPMFESPDGGDVDDVANAKIQAMAETGQQFVMLLGRYEATGYKNSPAALEVFERIHAQVPEARMLVLAREGEFTIPPAIADAVVFLGFVSDLALLSIMRQCKLGLSLSLWEGFNLPLAEMQWLGIPALAFSLAAHAEVVLDPCMLCARPDDMASKAVRILREGWPPHIKVEGRLERFRSAFSWRATLIKYDEALARVLALPAVPIDVDAQRWLEQLPRLVIIDCTCSSIDPANPGVIRVTRRLCQALQQIRGIFPVFVRWDPALDYYRLLSASEGGVLATFDGPNGGELQQAFSTLDSCLSMFGHQKRAVLLLPEVILDGAVQKRFLWARARGLAVAGLLYDVIPMSHPLFCAREVVERFPEYLEALASADAVWSISNESLKQFRVYARRSGLPKPAGEAVQLPGQFSAVARSSYRRPELTAGDVITILCVCSIEPRKNHRTLVQAYQLLKSRRPDLPLKLVLVGHRFAEADDLASWLQRVVGEDASIVWSGLLPDCDLASEFERAAFTVYPSVVEGFGLPIMESLWMGKPCICHYGGVMAELAAPGGCLTTDMTDPQAVAASMERLATESGLLSKLSLEAIGRDIQDWAGYGDAISTRLIAL
ncbi:glycosyltransferase [Variovorax sp. J22R133]|uniref:glycosyltransferase n=1 Tax=Variovorax brevis TaxID=3053503 RepID=UPI00257619E0|nr:glycosyltransferase [Variovorax sp. J22R133]MDM0114691.1 glycosyltransferase [Variovorax sp. J22R133]